MQLHYARSELENVGWERMKLQKHLQTAMKEHRMMELILAHLEDELDNAISKIHLLQDELKEVKNENLRLKLLKPESGALGRNLETNEALDQRRKMAIIKSLFSAVLSLFVGMIIWEAEDPCMPLVVALFTVVGMSLMSVVQFFSTIKNKPASDAVTLLSLNWFILGMLACPILPRLERIGAPLALRIAERALRLVGVCFS